MSLPGATRGRGDTRFVAGVEATLERRAMLKGGERLMVAVSGGPDSLALLYALGALAPSWGFDLHVAHFDHRTRPGSEADAAFVGRVARRLRLPSTIGSADPSPTMKGRSPEEAARERRLRFLEDAADAAGCSRIATGHTLDDQAETVLMRLLAGAGPRGLGGIPPVRGPFVRPLIDRTRDEVEAFCRALRLRPRRDPTNASPAFLRNVIRAEVLPLVRDRVNSGVSRALARAADVLRDEDAFLDEHARVAIDVPEAAGQRRLDVEALRRIHPALRRRAVRLACPDPGPGAAHVEAVLRLVAAGRSGDAIDLPQGLNVRLEYGSLVFGRRPSSATPIGLVPLAVPGRTPLDGWGVVAAHVERRRPGEWPDGKERCVLDLDSLASPLAVRGWRRGDRYRPLGMTGTRAVSDVLAERKVPRDRRGCIPIVTAGDRIVWIVGHGVGEDAKVTEGTRRFLWLTAEGGLE